MTLTGIHLLLTYQCTHECDHCFVWGSPQQQGTMSVRQIETILKQARDLRTVDWIYFEGGEPFLYYPVLVRGAEEASLLGFRVGIVSNAYWATSVEDACEWLRPFARTVQDFSVSSDVHHENGPEECHPENARRAAERLGIPVQTLRTADSDRPSDEEGPLMYRGRAAQKLVPEEGRRHPSELRECPYEDLRDPGRVHVDAFGNVHLCQGISLGNLFETPLERICATYDPDSHPIAGPLLAGGPHELARRYDVPEAEGYADACHLCDEIRRSLRPRFPEVLRPDAMYGAPES